MTESGLHRIDVGAERIMITGVDEVFVTAVAPGPAVTDFLEGLSARWTDMRVAVTVDESQYVEFVEWADARTSIPPDRGEIMIVRDPEMVASWDEYGYQIPGSPEGPLTILYEPCPVETFSATVTSDPYARDAGFGFEKYDTTIVGRGMTLVTAVVPDADGDFSREMLDKLAASFTRDR